MSASETLRWLVTALDDAGIPYMIVGSFASSAHGAMRTTRDVDVVIDPSREAFERFLSGIDDDRYYIDRDVARDAMRLRTMVNIIDSKTGWKVDLVIRKHLPHAVAEFERRVRGRILGVDVHLATAEDVIVAKLAWARAGGSDRQLDDVRGVLAAGGAQLDLAYVSSWAETLGLTELWERVRATSG